MCQICTLEATSKRYPWPVPVRPHVATFQAQITPARDACHAYREVAARKQEDDGKLKPEATAKLKAAYGDLNKVEVARETWWQSKKQLRETLREDIENERKTQNFKAATQGEKAKQAQRTAQEKYNELQAINTRAVNMIADMYAFPEPSTGWKELIDVSL
jgi:hypothetical protein